MLFTTTAFAESSSLNLSLPGAPGSYQSDKFRAGELDCMNAIGSATNLEFGVTGIIDKGRYDTMNNYFNDTQTGDIGVYARITIPLGDRAKSRIDCNRLYELEIRKKVLELQKLEQEIKQLKTLQFEE
jgi:hypothetical protein|tara:strand:- start:859 stop:1242 length:384 start_codon:yes stop_codon:yes gene_type:complete